MEKILAFLRQKKLWTNMFFILIAAGFYIGVKMLTNIYITVQFDDLEPFQMNMPVYYKGFKVGHTRTIKPSKDFKHTLVRVVITYEGLKLPKNTTALVKKREKKEHEKYFDYMELEYPDSPSIYFLKNGSVIKGKTSLDWNALIAQQADKGKLDDISNGINSLLTTLNDTSQALGTIFVTINDILMENRPNLLVASTNLSKTTDNLYDVSYKMNTSLSQERLDNTTGGFEGSSRNVDEAAKNVKEMTENLNQMMPYIDATIMDVNSTICNINQISAGVLETLQKRMGLMKLLIGKPVDKKNCCP